MIELLIFLAIFCVVSVVMVPMLYATIETRMRQQTIELVEDNAGQALQQIERRIRNAERIISPALGATGSVLVLQMASGAINPTIIGVQTGALVVIEKDVRKKLTSSQVAVSHFVVRTTSTSAAEPSTFLSFKVSRTIRLQMPHTYTRYFESAAALHPADVPTGDCGCSSASCSGNIVMWYVCSGGSCSERQDVIECP
jgi:type II secretory pathway pseudopilin PulG